MVMNGPPAGCLAGPAVPGVIGVPGRHLVLHRHGDQPVQGVISEGVSAVGNGVAVGVIGVSARSRAVDQVSTFWDF